jgi:hypothetical protein
VDNTPVWTAFYFYPQSRGGIFLPDVNCTVDNCKYWTDKNLCEAQQIVIQSDEKGGFSQGADLKSLAATPADSNDDTCCQTFKVK